MIEKTQKNTKKEFIRWKNSPEMQESLWKNEKNKLIHEKGKKKEKIIR